MNNLSKSIVATACAGLIIWYFWPNNETNLPLESDDITKPRAIPAEIQDIVVAPKGKALSLEKQQKLDRLREKAIQMYLDTYKTEGAEAKTQVGYDGDWCNIHQDVIKSDRILIQKERLEFDFERGNGINDKRLDTYYAAYKASTEEELRELTAERDKLAMRTLLSRLSSSKTLTKSLASELIVMGDTGIALESYVRLKGYEIALGLINDNIDNKTVIKQLLSTLAYVEYGLRRHDFSGLRAYSVEYESHKDRPLGQIMRDIAANPRMQQTIERLSHTIEDSINKGREKRNLPPLPTSEEATHVELRTFEAELGNMQQFSPELLNHDIYPTAWKDSYLNTEKPCVKRHFAYYKFFSEDYPAIRKQANAITSRF